MLPQVLLVWLMVINVVTAIAYAWDKTQARRGGRRVPEKRLFLLNFLGGFGGAWLAFFGMRHKSSTARSGWCSPWRRSPGWWSLSGCCWAEWAGHLIPSTSTIPSTSRCRPRRSGTRVAGALRDSWPWWGSRPSSSRLSASRRWSLVAHAAARLACAADERPDRGRHPIERSFLAPDPSTTLAASPPRLSREDLAAAVRDGSSTAGSSSWPG